MCQKITDFCNGSARPLLYVGAALSAALAISIGYTACTSHALYSQIDPDVAGSKSISYHLQLATALYLLLITLLSCYAAHSEQKHSIRALAVLSAVNCVLAIAATLMMPSAEELRSSFVPILEEASKKYDFNEAPLNETVNHNLALDQLYKTNEGSAQALNSTANGALAAKQERKMTPHNATQIWDSLQARGCCGIINATSTWQNKIPKSCCQNDLVEKTNDKFVCKSTDANHEQGCLDLVGKTSITLYFLLITMALVNWYLAVISGISTYRTIHYNEASQSAYT